MAEAKLDVKTADGVADCCAYTPDGAGPWPAVLFYPDGLGVRPAIREMAARVASHGYAVLLPNVFYRSGPFAPFDPKTAWSDPKERERVMALIKSVEVGPAMRDVPFYLSAIADLPGARADKVGCVGYCLGGRLAFAIASAHPDRIAAAASIHGGGLVTDQPDSLHERADKVRARLYFGVADNDQGCTPEHQAKLKAALDAAGVRYQMELYSGAHHGFAIPDMPTYDAKAAEQHWQRVLGLFGEALGGR